MAKKNDHKGEEPIGWVTVKGKHFPKWKDGTIGWEDGTEKLPTKTTTKEVKKVSKEDREEMAMDLVDSKDYIGDKELAKRALDNLKSSGYDLGKGATINSAELVEYDGKKWGIVETNYTLKGGDYGSGQDFTERLQIDVSKKAKSSTPKKTTMNIGNGLRLTADVSDPYKNYSEVERAKKVNREKQYANKKLNQYRKAAKEEKEKAQSIADAISAKTGIANTGSRNARYDTSRSKKVPSYSAFEKQFLKESGEDVWNMSLQRYNRLKKQAREIYEKQYGKKK